MKHVYWRPQGTPVLGYVIIALFALLGMVIVEHFQTSKDKPFYKEKMAASRLCLKAMETIRSERLQRGIPLDTVNDPTGSGLIGFFATTATSDFGDLSVKQTTINPNFAAVVVDLVKRAGVNDGDTVAVSFSGSYPALNISVGSALKALSLNPVIISSVNSSQWGANHPQFLWLDMEKALRKDDVVPFVSVAAYIDERDRQMTRKGRLQAIDAIRRHNLPLIAERSARKNADEKMNIFLKTKRPRLYVEVAGTTVATGLQKSEFLIKPSLGRKGMPGDGIADSATLRFLREGIPVVHLGNIKGLATEYRLPIAPTSMPEVGDGRVFSEQEYNPWLAGAVFIGIVLGLYGFSRSDWGFRVFAASTGKEEVRPPEPMV